MIELIQTEKSSVIEENQNLKKTISAKEEVLNSFKQKLNENQLNDSKLKEMNELLNSRLKHINSDKTNFNQREHRT